MKKFVLVSVACILFLSMSGILFPSQTFAATPSYRLYVDQVQLNTKSKSVPIVQNGTMMVPMQAVFAALGYTTSIRSNVWSMKNNEGHSIVLTINSKTAKVDGSKKALPTAPQKISGTAYISLKSLGQIADKTFGIDNIRSAVWLGEKPILNSFDGLWGATTEQVKTSVDYGTFVEQSSNNDVTIMKYTETIDGTPFTLYPIFYKDALIRIVEDGDLSSYSAADPYHVATMLGVYIGAKDELSLDLGKATNDRSFKEPQGNEQLTRLVYSMQYQSFQYKTEWKDGHTVAAMQLSCDGSSYALRITITDASADSTVLRVLDETL